MSADVLVEVETAGAGPRHPLVAPALVELVALSNVHGRIVPGNRVRS